MKKLTLDEIRSDADLVRLLEQHDVAVNPGKESVILFLIGGLLDLSTVCRLGAATMALRVVIPSTDPEGDAAKLRGTVQSLHEERRAKTTAASSLSTPRSEPTPTVAARPQKVLTIAGEPRGATAIAAVVAAAKVPSVAPSKAPEPVIRELKGYSEPPPASKRPVLDIVGERERAAKSAAEARAQQKALPPPPPPAAPPPAPPKTEKPAVASGQTMSPSSVLVVAFRDEKGERILFSGYPADFQKVHIAGLSKGEIRYVLGGELVNESDVNIFVQVCQLWDTPRGVAFRQENKHLVKMYPAFRKERKKLREIVRPKVESRASGFESTARRSTVPHPGKNWGW